MNLYSFVTSIHVVVAILGVGPLMALALMTRRPPLPVGAPRPMPPEAALRAFLRLLRLCQVSLGMMLVSGATLVAIVHGAFGRQLWMIISVVLFVLLGGGTALVQRNLKKALATTGSIVEVDRAHRWLLAMCAVVVVIAGLMEAKPF